MINEATELTLYLLRKEGYSDSATEKAIDNAISNSLKIFPNVGKEELKRYVESEFSIWVEEFRIIEKEEARLPWLLNKKSSTDWRFWNRYKWFLEEKMRLSPKTISSVDRLTDRTLDALFDPKIKGIIDKRGMVVGQVQSGKTANYIGLITKAADAGFRMIIILAGIHKNLRSQTQLRIDQGFLGFDTQHDRAFAKNNLWIGVGELKSSRDLVAHSLTSSQDNGDFSAGAANSLALNFQTKDPIIAVVKKNARVLERLQRWLAANAVKDHDGNHIVRDKSLLIIDDEADNASINTKSDELNPTKINGLIRNLLRLFDKSAYVGYTATPFANIFIPLNDDNLFPRDFIINIPAPTNYIGPQKIFGFEPFEEDEEPTDTLPVVIRINDYEDFVPNKHRIDDQLPDSIPDSLKIAIKCFIVTCAIRRARGQKEVHNSMLVHVSRFVRWQGQITELINRTFDYYRRGIEQNIDSIIQELKKIFEEDSHNYKSYNTISRQILNSDLKDLDPAIKVHDWESVKRELHDAASRIQVKEIHGGAADVLNYYDHKDGLSVIAIGGNKLSRGLTLEGLSVSYYLRSSRMYDTLMQMGRWFGYRSGYVDLCRLFTSRELNEWFCHITLASEDLRNEFDYMSDIAGSTPEKYALKVRTHPGVLQISATNKIRTAVRLMISWSGALVESYKLSKEKVLIDFNFKLVNDWIPKLREPTLTDNSYLLWKKVNPSLVVDFIDNYRSPENLASNPVFLSEFIKKNANQGEMISWNIALMSKISGKTKKINSVDVGLFLRTEDTKQSDSKIYYLKKSHIISPNHEFIDLSVEEYQSAMEKTKLMRIKNGIKIPPLYPNGAIVRNEIRDKKTPLLLIYLLDPSGAGLSENSNPVIGFAISFPGSENIANIEYAVHEQLLSEFDTDIDFEDYDPDED